MTINILYLELSPVVIITIVMGILFRLRRDTNFVSLFMFHKPMWVALIISSAIATIGYFGASKTPDVFLTLGIDYHPFGLQDIIVVGSILAMLSATLCVFGCFVLWLRITISSIYSYRRRR